MSFKFIPPDKFFDLLAKDVKFCDGLGKAMLFASQLETNLRAYLKKQGIKGIRKKSTLGELVKHLKKNDLLSLNGTIHFDQLVMQRNCLTHNLYGLFSGETEETLLPGKNLVEMDLDIFSERAQKLSGNFLTFTNIVKEATEKNKKLLC